MAPLPTVDTHGLWAPRPAAELRGVWIASHHHSSVWQSREALARALDELVARGCNTIFPAVWNRGFTAWPSAVMERQGLPAQDPFFAAAGVDPLAWLAPLARERGLRLIPWLEYGFAAEPVGAPGPLLAARPEWAALDRRGQGVVHGGLRWLNALHPGARALLEALVLEVAERYDVAGLQGDDHIALPSAGSHDAATLARYRQACGREPSPWIGHRSWSRFRREAISRWVRQVGQRLHQLRPDLLWCLSPAPPPLGLRELMQDSASWLGEGSVDLLLPQWYRPSFVAFRHALRSTLRQWPAERRGQVVAGLALRAHGRDLGPDTVRRMVDLCRREGLGGVALFHLTLLLGADGCGGRPLGETRGGIWNPGHPSGWRC